MKKVGYLLIGLIAGAAGMRFCMKNEKAQEFFKKARKRGEEVLGTDKNNDGEEKPKEDQSESEEKKD